MTLKAGSNQCNTGVCLLYRVNELGTVAFIVYVDDMMEIGDKPEFTDAIECINK